MVNNLFGQYMYKKTLLHNLDPRVKILLLIFISIFLFLFKTYPPFVLISSFITLLILISKIKIINLLKNLKPFIFFFAFILLMYALFSQEKLSEGIIVVWRFILLIIIASILTYSTSITQLVYAIEKLLKPLKLVGVSPRNIAVMVSATIRFIPLLLIEANKIKDAQKSRGANFRKIKHIIQLINTLLIKTFNKASNLADAMESRGYRDYSYSHFRELKLGMKDYISALFVIIIGGISIWM